MASISIRIVLGFLSLCLFASGGAAQDVNQTGLIDEQITQQATGLTSVIEANDLAINNPSSIPEQLRRDWQTNDYLFQIPGFNCPSSGSLRQGEVPSERGSGSPVALI